MSGRREQCRKLFSFVLGFYHRFPKTMVTFDEYLDLFAMNAIRKDPAKITGNIWFQNCVFLLK